MSNQIFQRRYWSKNLDSRNLGGEFSRKRFHFKEEAAFYFSPEQQYAVKKLWGEEGLSGKRILEIGCGVGVFALFLARQEAEVFVVDLSLERLKFLKNQAEKIGLGDRIRIICGAAEDLPFASEAFDALYTKSVLIHTDIEPASRESYRVLRRGGTGIFVEPLNKNPFAWFYRTYLGPKEWKSITNYFDTNRLRRLAKPFGNIRIKYFYLFSFAAFFFQFGVRSLTAFQFLVRCLNELDNALFRVLPFLKRFAWFAVIHAKKR
ncbi:methyltransferase domain-containing protein [Candidatus Sumerlaeota bacterium]|nr:methyltransferase domain-containing protein [Candidatus Sumerlaeota bacterium]